jgi:ribosomal protein S18 acetylase RimI-like enzyme
MTLPLTDGAGEMSRLHVRSAGLSDAPELSRLIAGFRDHLKATAPTDGDIRRHLPRALRDPSIEFGCASLGGEAVGYTQTWHFTSVWAAGLEARLEDLFVVAGARRQAVGRALLRHALASAEARGALRFSLNTNERSESAQSLYRSESLAPVSHALYPGGREVLWSRIVGTVQPVAGS